MSPRLKKTAVPGTRATVPLFSLREERGDGFRFLRQGAAERLDPPAPGRHRQ